MQNQCLGSSRALGARCNKPYVRSVSRGQTKPAAVSSGSQQTQDLPTDPEAKFRHYGPEFGGSHKMDWLDAVPRVRVRRTEDRQLDELLELAVLNERLSGNMPAWEARRRLEYLRLRRKNWERIYEYITKTDAVATLAAIEEASRKVHLDEQCVEGSPLAVKAKR